MKFLQMKDKGIILYILMVFLIASNTLLLLQNRRLRKTVMQNWQSYQSELTSLKLKKKTIPTFELYDVNSRQFSSKEILRSKPFTLFIFFSPSDCAVCLEEKTLWRRLQKLKSVGVVGISSYPYFDELKQWVQNVELSFPILYDQNAGLTQSLGVDKTPIKVLVNSEGKILLVDGVRISAKQQKLFINLLSQYINK